MNPAGSTWAEAVAGPVGPPFISVGAVEAAGHVDACAGDVAGLGRAEERHQIRHVAGIAEVPQRDLAGELLPALGGRMQALIDLFAVDASGGEAVHGDPVAAHVA